MVFGENLTCNSRVFTRLKTVNSIKDKITKYNNLKEEKGGVPICNCLNDIFGVRIIQNENINLEQVREIFEKTNIKLKFVNSSKGLYKATHLYFKNTNFDFPWELQIWRKEDEDNNIISHAKYKQDYIDWVTKGEKVKMERHFIILSDSYSEHKRIALDILEKDVSILQI